MPQIQFSIPTKADCITWHAPIAPRRKIDRTNFRSIGHTRTLELLSKKPTQEHLQPLHNHLIGIISIESIIGQKPYFFRCKAKTHKVIKEKIMQFVRAYLIA